jgi:hypothetical protein
MVNGVIFLSKIVLFRLRTLAESFTKYEYFKVHFLLHKKHTSDTL